MFKAKSLFCIFVALVAMNFASCVDYDNSLTEIEDRLDVVEGTSLTTIDQQVVNINTSINKLEILDSSLRELVDELESDVKNLQTQLESNASSDEAAKQSMEAKITDINALIETLETKDGELDKKIVDLKKYVDDEITKTNDWTNATFATIKQYEDVQTEITAIKLLIEQSKNDISVANAKAIENAIAASESSMKSWVNEFLADGYYDIATIDAKLSSLETELGNADADLKKNIKDQQAALEQAKNDLTNAYKNAIADAIESNNGVINAAIANAVQKEIDKVNTKLAVIDNAIAGIQKDINDIKNNIATIVEQIKGINTSIGALLTMDVTLQNLIDDLESAADELKSQFENNASADTATKNALEREITNIKALIKELQAKDGELDQKITDLRKYVDEEISETESWASTTFATLEKYETMQTEIANLKGLINTYKTDVTVAYTKAIEEAIAASESSMKGWVNELLAEGYYNIATIDAKLSSLETKLGNVDAEMKKDIENQQTALEQAKRDLVAEYKKAIADAIEDNGVINEAIADAVQKALDNVNIKLTDINNDIAAIENEINNIKSDITSIESQIANINSSLLSLNTVDTNLKNLIDNLEIKAADLKSQLQNNTSADTATKNALETEITNIKALVKELQAKDGELDQKIADLRKYVDEEISETESWASTTFATLEKYETMQTEIANLKGLINTYKTDVTVAYTKAIEEAIAASESSMKGWVNELLAEGYYNIATIDAKLSSLETELGNVDAEIKSDIATQKVALETAKVELTIAYEKAISNAINVNNGIINKEITDAINVAKDDLQDKINDINDELENIEDRLAKLEDNFAKRIQSLRFIPAYSDGKVKMDYDSRETSLDFMVSPAAVAANIKDAFDAAADKADIIKAFVRYTADPSTRAANDVIQQTVKSIELGANGMFTVTVAENGLSDEFWNGGTDAIIYIQITDNNDNNVISEVVPMVAGKSN